MNTYKIHAIITWIPRIIENLMVSIIRTSWYYCHYKYGNGPKFNHNTNIFKQLYQNYYSDD